MPSVHILTVFNFQIDILSEVAFELGVDDLSEAALDLALSDLRLKVGKLPSDTFRRDRASESEKAEKLEAIKALSQSEATLQKAENEAHSKETEINQVEKLFYSKKIKMFYHVHQDKYSRHPKDGSPNTETSEIWNF